MPAARPSQASICNALSAVVQAGCQPGSLQVASDGSFRIELICSSNSAALAALQEIGEDDEVLSWDDVK